MRDKTRRTVEISEVCGVENGEIKLNTLYEFVENEDSTLDNVKGELKRTENAFRNYSKLMAAGFNIKV